MWDFLYKHMINHLTSKIICARNNMHYTYFDLIKLAKLHGEKLRETMPPKSKCVIMCDSELNVAVSVLAAWYADLVPIPTSKNYGIKQCQAIIDLVSPDLIIVDNAENIDISVTVYNYTLMHLQNVRETYYIDEVLIDAGVIMCTSGTTGVPKGAVITVNGLINNIIAINDYFDINCTDTILIARPLYHCAVMTGELLVSLINGTNIVFFDQTYTPFSLVTLFEKYNITIMCGTPTLFRHISTFITRGQYKTNLSKIVLSGECITKEIALVVRTAFPYSNIYNVYGLTEAAPRVSYLLPNSFDMYPESVGTPLVNTEVIVLNSDRSVAEFDQDGLIFVKSPSIMKCYYRNPELTQKVLKDGWLNTGDIGHKDSSGNLYIMSRADDMIIKAGMNIYPREIENQVNTLIQVKECMVYGYVNLGTQNIGIYIVLEDSYRATTLKEVKLLLTEILPNYQLPSLVTITDSIPKTASGKIIRSKF